MMMTTEYFGISIPAGRALHFSASDEHSRPFAYYIHKE
jgi:hypothetical protein